MIKQTQLKKYYKVASSKETGSTEAEDLSITTDPIQIIKRAIENARPLMALEKVKVGSVDYQIPKPITKERSEFDGMYIKKCRNDFLSDILYKNLAIIPSKL